jgi:VWFA-related protein
MRREARAVTLIVAGVTASVLALRVSVGAQQDTPTFRSGVQLIDVDVVVTGRDGKAVRDLTKDDFEIVEESRTQQIQTFSLIDLPYESVEALAKRQAGDVESDTVTNTAPEGRTYVLLLDAGSANLLARHRAEQWLDEVVQPGDRVAVVHPQGTFSDAQAFTSSRRLLLNAINRMVWGTVGAGDVRPIVRRYLDTFEAIQHLAERLGGIAGRRKAIVWFNQDINLHPHSGLRAGETRPPREIAELTNAMSAILDAWRDAARAAVNNNVAIYPVDPRGLRADLGMDSLVFQASMREIAEETGGVTVGVNSNSFSEGFATIVQDASVYYLLGYSPQLERTDGKFHPIEVRVKRPGVTVRARRGYYAPSLDAPPPKPLPPPPEGVSVAARDALRRPVATRGLGIDVTTASFRGSRKDNAVVITAHVRGETLALDAGRQLAVSYQVFDVEGKVATGFYKVFDFNLRPENRERAAGRGLQFVERITLKPGRYELRLVAEQPGGPLGSVVTHIDAAEFDDELAMSGVTLTSRRANEVLLVGDRALRSALAADPTARRTFRAADGLSAYAEVYTELDDDSAATRISALRVATLEATIAPIGGGVARQAKGQRVSAEAVGKIAREGFRTDFDLTRLQPGGYVLTLEGRSPKDRKRIVSRQIPFDIVE